jgi:polyhydroxyalkanoate synthase
LVTLAAPWHFSRYPDAFRNDAAGIWSQGQQAIAQWGVMPMEVMQQGFWSIDRAATIAKFDRFSNFEEDSPAHKLFVKVEDWANGGAPLSGPAATELFENLFARDDPGQGHWHARRCISFQPRIASSLMPAPPISARAGILHLAMSAW